MSDQFVFDFDQFTVGDLADLLDTAKGGNLDVRGQIDVISRFLVAWPYEGDPADPKAYESLKIAQFSEISKQMTKTMSGYFEDAQGN